MKYSIKTLSDVAILEIHGQWVNGPEDYGVHQEVKNVLLEEIDAGARHVVVDLEKCRFVASGGIGGLGAIKASAAKRDGRVVLCGVNRRVRRALVVAGMWNYFEHYETREEALASLSQVSSHS